MPMTKLTLFCASHLNSDDDIHHVVTMINSVIQQTQSTSLWLSISYNEQVSTLRMEADIKTLFRRVAPGSRYVSCGSRRSQFEHLNLLLQKYINVHPDCITTGIYSHWVAFVDDDDEIGYRRMAAFCQLIRASPCEGEIPDAVCIQSNHQREYWEFAVTLRMLKFFFDRSSLRLWKHMYADMFFCRFITGFVSEGRLAVRGFHSETDHTIHYTHTASRSEANNEGAKEEILKGIANYCILYPSRKCFDDDNFVTWFLRDNPRSTEERIRDTLAVLRRERCDDIKAFRECPTQRDYLLASHLIGGI
jgi:hypothetical protein